MLPAMGRLFAMCICLSLGLGCGGEKKKKEEEPSAKIPDKTPDKAPVEVAPQVPPPTGALSIEFLDLADDKAPTDKMQAAVRASNAELRGCFTGTQASKANVNLIIVAATGTVDSVTPSADREKAEVCLKKVLGELQFPTWDGDRAALKIKFAMQPE